MTFTLAQADAKLGVARAGQAARHQGRQARRVAAGRHARSSSARGGTTEVSGPELRKRFGLFDTWAYFTTSGTSTSQQGATGATGPTGDGTSGGTPPG